MSKKKVCIVGMGPAGLMAGTVFLERGFEVHFFEQNKAAGRKFLVAGHGGFNLTHSEEFESFTQKYNHSFIQSAFKQFDNNQWIAFLKKVNVETFVGSSGKIFPLKGIKPIEVLTNWLDYILSLGATVHNFHQLIDFDEREVKFSHKDIETIHQFDHLVLAIGGASWKKTGSSGEWKQLLVSKEIECIDFKSSNSGLNIENWDKISELEGQILKNCTTSFGEYSKKGDVILSNYGVEGTPIYHLNKAVRENPTGFLSIDLKPTKSKEEILEILLTAKNITDGLKKCKLSKTAIQFLKKWTTKEEYSSASTLANSVKEMRLHPHSFRPIDEVISTIGGVSMNAITENFTLKKFPSISVCGEMLDWDAPTGGYLIQGCISSGYVVGKNGI